MLGGRVTEIGQGSFPVGQGLFPTEGMHISPAGGNTGDAGKIDG